ncbi:hypothetical protein P691DRAFT_765633 [Macrolepiota fuliginosa MF-IS2]|uniref:Uncharacterized protein n=1 Tax=Macrolepiota fuliginosa MF-IS2 TaxID=1400762 RepID=A0A9P5X1T3_9AGAR|nr:hypothetical protein P691DRAFT_765633 [Macrolepiota fuliginosa MF-IS2]
MAATLTNTQAVSTIVEMLGGMNIAPDALEWTNDVPAARAIMNAIAEQLCFEDASTDAICAALRDIALEDQETQILKGLSSYQKEPSAELSAYRLPSNISRETEYIRLEVQALEAETERLKVRSQQIRKASQHMTQDIHSLQDTISTVRSTNKDTMNRVDDLSLQMDGAIADATQASCSLLSTFDPVLYEAYATSFDTIDNFYSNYTDTFTSYLDYIDTSSQTLAEEAEISADELEALMKKYSPEAKWEDIPLSVREYYMQQAYLEQVGDLCDKMEGVSVSQELSQDWIRNALYLAEAEMTVPEDFTGAIIPGVREEIGNALARDQVTYLDSRGAFLDNAISVMEDTIMTPLDNLLSHLSLEEKLVQDTESLCGVLGEEIESAVETLATPQSSAEIQHGDPAATSSAERQSAVNDTGLESLKGLEGWEREVEIKQRQFGPGHDGLFQALNPLNTANNHFLDAIYANSPLNTSPPFAYSPYLTNLMDEARTVTTQLSSETDRLTKEVENTIESRRTQRKLGAFVDQWVTAQMRTYECVYC